jgi:hypothetical protein
MLYVAKCADKSVRGYMHQDYSRHAHIVGPAGGATLATAFPVSALARSDGEN